MQNQKTKASHPHSAGWLPLKRLLPFLLCAGMAATPAASRAQEADTAQGNIVVGCSLGLALPNSGISASLHPDLGGQFLFGYAVDGHFSVFLSNQVYVFQNAMLFLNVTELLFVPTVKYAFLEGRIKPYAAAGAGLNITNTRDGFLGSSAAAFTVQFGLGIQAELNDRTRLFLEGKYTRSFSAPEKTFFPVLIGVAFDLK